MKVYLLMIHESGLDEDYEPFQITKCAGVFDSPEAAEQEILRDKRFIPISPNEISKQNPKADFCWRWRTEIQSFHTASFAAIEAKSVQGMPGEGLLLDIGNAQVSSRLMGLVHITEPQNQSQSEEETTG